MLRSSAPGVGPVVRQTVAGLGLIRGLYRGCMPPLLTSGCISMCIWTGFEAIKRRLHQAKGGDGPVALSTVWVAAACAPMLMLPLLVPQQRLSKLLQVNQRTGNFYSSRSCASAIVRHEGVRGLYRGGSALALQDFFGRANDVTCYVACKAGFTRLNQNHHERQHKQQQDKAGLEPAELSMGQRLIAGAASGTVGWIFTYPVDCVKARLMTQRPGEPLRWHSFRSCAYETWHEGGVRRLYRGLGLCLARGVPVAMVALPTYDLARLYWGELLLPERAVAAAVAGAATVEMETAAAAAT